MQRIHLSVNRRAFSTNLYKEVTAMKGTPETLKKRLPLTKIVATIGPASENLPMLSHVMNAGMRLMRINFSHATYEEADLRVGNLAKCFGLNHADGKPVNNYANMRSVMLDTQGPEIRTGSFGNGVKEVELMIDQKIILTNDADARTNQTKDKIWVSYQKLHNTVSVGSRVLLDDGAVEVVVESKSTTNNDVTCRVLNQGTLGNKKGVNMPGLKVELPAMCDKDKVDIRWGIQNNIDFIAASFVRKASDVTEIRDYTRELMKEFYPKDWAKRPLPHIISKIESVEALQNFDHILEESEAIMVARGDLAVEIPMETLANVQKEIVKRCNLLGKPVIVATQMLETMQKNPRPTRAECTDVANAVFDGADCVMLSGESAKGKYPVETVSLMNKIVTQSELSMKETVPHQALPTPVARCRTESFAHSIVQFTHSQSQNDALKCIVVMESAQESKFYNLATRISKYRPNIPVIVMVPDHKHGRLLQIYKNIHPIYRASAAQDTVVNQADSVLAQLVQLGVVNKNEHVVVVGDTSRTMHLKTA